MFSLKENKMFVYKQYINQPLSINYLIDKELKEKEIFHFDI